MSTRAVAAAIALATGAGTAAHTLGCDFRSKEICSLPTRAGLIAADLNSGRDRQVRHEHAAPASTVRAIGRHGVVNNFLDL